MKTCSYCGRQNEDDSSGCRECGTEFYVAPQPAAPLVTLKTLREPAHVVWLVAAFVMAQAIIRLPTNEYPGEGNVEAIESTIRL